MVGTELISMGTSSILGFGMKMWAQAQADKQKQFEMMLKQEKYNEESRQQAATRGGVWVRRFIVLVVFGILAAPIISPDVVMNFVLTKDVGFLDQLFGPSTETVITPIKGVIYDDTFRSMLSAVIGFYFGSSQASR